jgi:hypothetical protein
MAAVRATPLSRTGRPLHTRVHMHSIYWTEGSEKEAERVFQNVMPEYRNMGSGQPAWSAAPSYICPTSGARQCPPPCLRIL